MREEEKGERRERGTGR
jgi:hypothetical protein